MKVLITGGAGYIGSHTILELLSSGHEVVAVDNLSNSKETALDRVAEITGKPIHFHDADIRDAVSLDEIFTKYEIDAVIHFAGLKAVGESVENPMAYYDNNVNGTLRLCEVMSKHGVKKMVFSSSATVYGDPHTVPILEDFPRSATNPYGRTKLMIEDILSDFSRSDNEWAITLLRYFNPVGAHKSGWIGEDPSGTPNNLLPYVSQVAVGKLEKLRVFGNDYDTPDGTGVRDYIHVVDLAKGHLAALNNLKQGVSTYNLGTGQGYSVLDMVNAFAKASGKEIPYEIVARRAGDVAACYADTAKAEAELGWKAEKGLEEICADAWKWQSQNPNGYDEYDE